MTNVKVQHEILANGYRNISGNSANHAACNAADDTLAGKLLPPGSFVGH